MLLDSDSISHYRKANLEILQSHDIEETLIGNKGAGVARSKISLCPDHVL